MLARSIGRAQTVHALTGEGQFFEYRESLAKSTLSDKILKVISLVKWSGAELSEQEVIEIENTLVHTFAADPSRQISASDVYAQCMAVLAKKRGATRWAQKATSYIFHVDAITACFPDARLIFLARNPLDLAASMKRRGGWSSVARMITGWNRGVSLALKYARSTENTRVFRYEDFVLNPTEEMSKICAFCGLDFDEGYLDIPHVNRSESPYNRSSNVQGISSSRLGYYREALSTTERQAVLALINKRLLDKLYPDMADEARWSFLATLYAGGLMAIGAFQVVHSQLSLLFSNPRHAIRRVRKRVFA